MGLQCQKPIKGVRTYTYTVLDTESVKSVCGTICSTTHSVYSVCVVLVYIYSNDSDGDDSI